MVHGENSETWQSTGHGASLQVRDSNAAGHNWPPWACVVATERLRHCEPAPHVAVQVSYWPQSDMAQSTGHGSSLHDRVSARYGQMLPPSAAWPVMLRERVWDPPSHDAEHVAQPDQSDTVQFTGHGPLSHA